MNDTGALKFGEGQYRSGIAALHRVASLLETTAQELRISLANAESPAVLGKLHEKLNGTIGADCSSSVAYLRANAAGTDALEPQISKLFSVCSGIAHELDQHSVCRNPKWREVVESFSALALFIHSSPGSNSRSMFPGIRFSSPAIADETRQLAVASTELVHEDSQDTWNDVIRGRSYLLARRLLERVFEEVREGPQRGYLHYAPNAVYGADISGPSARDLDRWIQRGHRDRANESRRDRHAFDPSPLAYRDASWPRAEMQIYTFPNQYRSASVYRFFADWSDDTVELHEVTESHDPRHCPFDMSEFTRFKILIEENLAQHGLLLREAAIEVIRIRRAFDEEFFPSHLERLPENLIKSSDKHRTDGNFRLERLRTSSDHAESADIEELVACLGYEDESAAELHELAAARLKRLIPLLPGAVLYHLLLAMKSPRNAYAAGACDFLHRHAADFPSLNDALPYLTSCSLSNNAHASTAWAILESGSIDWERYSPIWLRLFSKDPGGVDTMLFDLAIRRLPLSDKWLEIIQERVKATPTDSVFINEVAHQDCFIPPVMHLLHDPRESVRRNSVITLAECERLAVEHYHGLANKLADADQEVVGLLSSLLLVHASPRICLESECLTKLSFAVFERTPTNSTLGQYNENRTKRVLAALESIASVEDGVQSMRSAELLNAINSSIPESY